MFKRDDQVKHVTGKMGFIVKKIEDENDLNWWEVIVPTNKRGYCSEGWHESAITVKRASVLGK